MSWDDERIGRALRELRRRSGKTQEEAAAEAGIAPRAFRRVERKGTLGSSVTTLRAAFAPFEARVNVSISWHGAELDRLLDRRHAAVVEHSLAVLNQFGWRTATEVTFSEYGERGSIDVFGFHEQSRACLVEEAKSDWGSMDETNRMLDVKARLAPKLCLERFGMRPAHVSRVLVFPDDMTLRRIADRHRETLRVAYPERARSVRKWLSKPDRAISGLWFLTIRTGSSAESDDEPG